MSDVSPSSTLQDAFQELIANSESLDAATLEAIIARYPKFATELTEFAVEWVLQDQLPVDDDTNSEDDVSSADDSAVPAALSRFRQQLDARHDDSADALVPQNPFTTLSPAELRQLASTVGLDKILLAKLRDRRLVAETLPASLNRDLAAALQVPPAALAAHLAAPATVPAGLSFKSAHRPEVGPKETFADAVQRSSLDDDAKARWLAME